MERATDTEGISYASLAEFVRDALRRRVEAINEAWRQARVSRNHSVTEPKKRNKGNGRA